MAVDPKNNPRDLADKAREQQRRKVNSAAVSMRDDGIEVGNYDIDPHPEINAIPFEFGPTPQNNASLEYLFPSADESSGSASAPASPAAKSTSGRLSKAAPESGSYPASAPNYPSLRYSPGESGTGLAFNVDGMTNHVRANCTETTGYCLGAIQGGLDASGFRINGMTLHDALPKHGAQGHIWAKEVSPLLQSDPRFSQVSGGHGAGNSSLWNYQAKKGDIAVWEGGPFGHIEVCTGARADGSPIWQSDFTARKDNWTGLRNPESHGNFRIFRQHTMEADLKTSPDSGPKADVKADVAKTEKPAATGAVPVPKTAPAPPAA
jgi:hypothetical protein